MRHPNYYKQIIQLLERLQKAHPKYNMGRHFSTAIDGDVWGISDKELLIALQNYEIELNMDVDYTEDIEAIIKDGMNLERMFEEEED